jgi:putative cell wall-binding protein
MRVVPLAAIAMVVGALPLGTASGAVAGSTPASISSVTPVWSQLTPATSPSARDAGISAFDPATGQLVLFGAGGVHAVRTPPIDNYTWTFDGAAWTKHVTSLVPHPQNERMAYDPQTKELLLYGDNGTWTWNGSQWTVQHPAQMPTLYLPCMATDAAAGELVMFGDDFSPPDEEMSPQTWTWRGGNWVQLPQAVSPPPIPCEMAYDAAHEDLVLVTAIWDAGEINGAFEGDTWTFDGTSWTQRESPNNVTGPVDFSTLTYDPAYGQVMTFGGRMYTNTSVTSVTNPWSWNGSTWLPVTLSPAPGARELAASAYDASTGQLVLFGGASETGTVGTALGDTWVLSDPGSSSVTPSRLSGADRQSTAVAVSASAFPNAGSASAVVLARADQFADALAGGPLAAAKHAPLLLTSPGSLDAVTAAEIQRVLPKGGTVYLLGGTSALSDAVATAITGLGDAPARIAGVDRYATAVAIAGAMGNPTTVFEASGTNFPDALSAVPAAVAAHGAILLTDGAAPAAVTSAYLTAHATSRYAVGGPASLADPSAIVIAGADRYATSDAVALAFFPTTTGVSVASGANFPDALAAGPVGGKANEPMLLVPPTGALPEPIASYLATHAGGIATVQAFGGPSAVADAVLAEVAQSLAG